MNEKKTKIIEFVKMSIQRIIFLALGASIAAFALECILIPNRIVDGGVIGISMMTAYKTGLPLGAIIVAFNFPFILMALKRLGRQFVFFTDFQIQVDEREQFP